MKLIITRQDLANSAAQLWKQQYFTVGGWLKIFEGDSESIHKELVALGSTPNPDDVDRIIGNIGWTTISCDSCREHVTEAIVGYITICAKCVKEAYGYLRPGD